jgi:hypothetical protein
LLSKYKSAVKGRASSKVAFDELDASVDDEQSQQWREEEWVAMESRGEYLRIYEVRTNKGRCCYFDSNGSANFQSPLQLHLWLRHDFCCLRMKLDQGTLAGAFPG